MATIPDELTLKSTFKINQKNMKKITKQFICITLAWLSLSSLKAQMSGTYNVPTDFSSIAAAISSLNAVGVSGPVTIDVTAGHTETATVGGYSLYAVSGASSSNPITFQKSGVGANPLIVAYTGTATPTSAIQDGVWLLIGADYITIDGIDISDPNTTNPATMEFGYGLFKASTSDGCQNNTIKNCVISLQNVNNATGSGPAVDGSRGINVVNALPETQTTVVTPSGASGTNSNNKFYSNTIQNCNIGIAIIGYAAATPFTLADTGNDVGGNSASTGNTIINFGGGGTASAAAGIRTLAQYNFNASYNTINNNTGAGTNHAAILRGIYLNTAVSANATVNNNTITVKGGGTSQQLTAIENVSGATAAANAININNNVITGCSYSTATSGVFYGIYTTASAATVNITGNTLLSNSTNATSGSYYPIYNTGAATSQVNILGNSINGVTLNAATTSLTFRGIFNSGGSNTSSVSVVNNSLTAITFAGAGSGETDMIYNSAAALHQTINNNIFNSISINTSGTSYIIYCNNTLPANGVRTINSNSVIASYSKLLSGGTLYGYYSNSTSPGTATEINRFNNFSNLNATGATGVNPWLSGDGATSSPYGPSKIIADNVFLNINGGTSAIVGITAGYSNINAPGTVSNNIVSNISCSCAITGIQLTQGSQNAFLNTVSSYSSFGSSAVFGIHVSSGNTQNIFRNKIYDLQGNLAGSSVIGINIASAINNINNNLISDLRTPAANAANPLIGISLTGGTTHNVYYNTVVINGSSSGTNFGSSALSVNASPSAITLRNNIFINNSTPSGTGLTVAYRRSSTTITNYASASNNNIYYAGTPGATRLLMYDGTNSHQTLGVFKTAVSPRESSSATENTQFLSLSGANVNFLHVDPSLASYAESGASNIAGYTNDFDGQVREGNPGYTGGGIAPDIGADEFEGIINYCSSASGGVISPASGAACAGQILSVSSQGVSEGIGTQYQWQVGTTPGGPYANVTGGAGATTPSYTSAPLPSGVFYVVLRTTCPAATLTAVSNEVTLTVNSLPTATASSSNSMICSGESFNLSGGTDIGTSFLWMGPDNFNSTTQNSSITNAGINASGTYTFYTVANSCTSIPSTVSVTVNFSPLPLTLTPVSASVCSGSSQTLAVSGGAPTPTLNSGNQTNQNAASTSASGYPAPYTLYYGGQRMQMLILASELSAAGFLPGSSLTSIQFPVVSLGSNWGTTTMHCQDFQVNIGNTSLNSLTTFQGGLTNVIAPSNFTPAVGYSNTHVFTTPFVWNGTSNVILETTFSNNLLGTANDLVVQYNSPTSFGSTIVYRADNNTSAAMASNNTVSYSYSARPDFKLNGTAIGSFSWSPATDLSATTGATVVSTPQANITYTVEYNTGFCATDATVSLSQLPSPVVSLSASQNSVCEGTSVDLTASGGDTYSWTASSATTNTISVAPSATTVYSVAGTSSVSGCSSTATVNIQVNPAPVLSVSQSTTTVCEKSPVTFSVTGADTYTWDTSSTDSVYVVNPGNSTTYTVTGTYTTSGCSSTQTAVINTNPLPVITVAQSATAVCLPATVDFTVSGTNSYSWSTGATTNTISLSPTSNTVIYVTGTDALGCETTETAGVNANPTPTVLISPSSSTVCEGATATFTATGANTYSWSNANTNAVNTLTVTAPSVITVTGTSAGCSATETVAVGTKPSPTLSILPANSATMCAEDVMTFTVSGADTFTWTPDNSNQATITINSSVSAVYTVIGTSSNNCTNTEALNIVIDPCTGVKNAKLNEQITVFPNPSSGVINVKFGFEGEKEISVTNSLGARVSTITTSNETETIDLGGYSKGIYFVKVSTKTESANYRIVIQ